MENLDRNCPCSVEAETPFSPPRRETSLYTNVTYQFRLANARSQMSLVLLDTLIWQKLRAQFGSNACKANNPDPLKFTPFPRKTTSQGICTCEKTVTPSG